MKSLTPNLFVRDMDATIAFYQKLGFRVVMTVPESGEDLVWAMMVCGDVTMMFQTFDSLEDELPEISRSNGGSLLLYIDIKDIRSFYASLEGRVNILKGLEKTFYGATEFSILDNNNYVLTFAETESDDSV